MYAGKINKLNKNTNCHQLFTAAKQRPQTSVISYPTITGQRSQIIITFRGCLHITLYPFHGLFFKTTWVSWHQKGRTNVDVNEARDDGVAVTSAGPYADHLQLTPDSTHTSTSSLTHKLDAIPAT